MAMRVLIVNIDSTIPNLALHKIMAYYRGRGAAICQIEDKKTMTRPLPLLLDSYDKIFVSCVFTWNRERCKKWEGIADIGGSGYSLHKDLPSKIDAMKPRINYGFITRGCIRKCPFCVVPEKEGKIKEVADLHDIWDGKAGMVTLMDNNILALPKSFFKVCRQIRKAGIQVDFNQGLDHRLLTDEVCQALLSLDTRAKTSDKIRFAYDDIAYKSSVLRALKMLKRNGIGDWKTRWYVYVGPEDTLDTVLPRVNLLRDWKQAVFLMRDRDKGVMANKDFEKIYGWTLHVSAFSMITFEDFGKNYEPSSRSKSNLLNV
jgi:hypothetical protein